MATNGGKVAGALGKPGRDSWTGLAELTPAQREELATGITPGVVEHLERCLRTTADRWASGRPSEGRDGDWDKWSRELGRAPIAGEFAEVINRDLQSVTYPPVYEFSGVEFADDESELTFLDEYQTTRRALRHNLEALLRAEHAYSYLILVRAAREKSRFEHANWAPWLPLHWFERLCESAERHLGRTPKTLELLRAYVQCVTGSGSSLLGRVVEIIDACGLVEDMSLAFESDPVREQQASWIHFRQPAAAAGWGTAKGASLAPPGKGGVPASGDGAKLPAFLAAVSDRLPMPTDDATPGEWARWVSVMLAAAEAARADGDLLFADGVLTGHEGEEGGASPDELAPLILKLLQEVLDEIFPQAAVHASAREAIIELLPPVAAVVSRDPGFFRDRRHPLRVWLGSLINAGVRISPEHTEDRSGAVGRYLGRVSQFAERLQAGAHTMVRSDAQTLCSDWLWAMDADDAYWLQQQAARIEPFQRAEHLARARRGLTVCVVETGANLPASAAEQIIEAWGEMLVLGPTDSTKLNRDVRSVVRAICDQASPREVNARVQRILADARESGIDDDRTKAVVTRLGQAHVAHMRAPREITRFEPKAVIRDRRSVRLRDDDPDLVHDFGDIHVYEANGIRLGDWVEFVDRETGAIQRVALVWRGEATRAFLFVALDGSLERQHSLQGIAAEIRESRVRFLPRDNPFDAILR